MPTHWAASVSAATLTDTSNASSLPLGAIATSIVVKASGSSIDTNDS
eukprot:CAMPEP_0174707188 /NCGR_PEP_ID=MMETSP1094-20130205/9772_1 /TAXON_ID=156173 /ORGANISM="Chrysochromulina brevifilum, Strain UTEX LB 985" /LENGTH=46 /DNA_ID= /DNA_START= /DNA_END= /DNA_ORIENTATION=